MLELAPLLSRQLVMVTGKGGIGKTLITAALAQVAAARGRRVLVAECAARPQLPPLFAPGPSGEDERQLAPGIRGINIDAVANFREYVVKYLGQKRLYDTVFSHKVVQSFTSTIPGLAEVMLLGRLFYHCELAKGPRPDLVVFDGPASGHFLSLMTTPDSILSADIGGPIGAETQRVKTFLADANRVGILFVGVAEELVVSECLDFLPRLAEAAPAHLLGLVVNRVPAQPPFGPASGSSAAMAYLGARFAESRAARQQLAVGLAGLSATYGHNLDLGTLPELGFVGEPLAPDFGERLFGGTTA